MRISERWQNNCMRVALEYAQQSKDPSTKVGATIVKIEPVPTLVSAGFNGFPHGVVDYESRLNDREARLLLTIHAEQNAILMAKGRLSDTALFATRPPCTTCAAWIAQTAIIDSPGIREVYATRGDGQFMARWQDDIKVAMTIFAEAGIAFEWVEP